MRLTIMNQLNRTAVFAVVAVSAIIQSPAHAAHMTTFTGPDLTRNLIRDFGVDAEILAGDTTVSSGSKGMVLVFLSATCPCSNSHLEVLKQLRAAHPDFQFIGVNSNQNETLAVASAYFSAQNLRFPVLRDRGLKLADRFHASKTPHVFVLNETGEIIYRGGVTDSSKAPEAKKQYLADVLNDIEAGRKPRLDETRTLGCAIDRGGN